MLQGVDAWQWVVGTAVTLILGYLTYRGGRYTADRAKEGATQSTNVDAQESALQAWKDLLQPHIDEVGRLRGELKAEREERAEKERQDAEDREQARVEVQQQITMLSERIDFLTIQLKHWKRLARVMARWATTLRDQVLSLGGEVPATPEELLLIQSLDDDDL